MRASAKPTNPQSEAQTAIRANLAAANAAWAALTPDVQAGWETYAAAVPWANRLGDTTYLTGKTMFVRTFIARANVGLAMVNSYPTTLLLPSVPDGVLTAGATAGSIHYAFTATQDWNVVGGALAIYGSKVGSSATSYFGSVLYRGCALGAATPVASPVDLAVYDYLDQAGNKVRLSARAILADGRVSSFASTVVEIGT